MCDDSRVEGRGSLGRGSSKKQAAGLRTSGPPDLQLHTGANASWRLPPHPARTAPQMPPLNPYGGMHPAFRPPVSAAMQKVASMPILGHPVSAC